MSSLGSPNPFFIAGKKAYEVERSLRFNDDDTAYLNRTPSSAGNRKTFTISLWIKRANLVNVRLISCYSANSDTGNFELDFIDDSFRYIGWSTQFRITNRKFRDPSAWYHIVTAIDTTDSTADDRVKIYVNGVQETSFSSSSNPSQDFDTGFNQASTTRIGLAANSISGSFDGYMAEINFIDGLQLTPSSFAETDAVTGEYKPKKYTGGYGTNGFYLNFSDNSGTTATTLGKDSSGNGNNFTPNNFATTDVVKDSPTNNFCTLNPLDKGSITLSEGNLKAAYAAAHETAMATFGMASGKWYWEVYNGTSNADGTLAGLGSNVGILNSHVGSTATSWGYENSGLIWNNSNGTGSNAALSNGDIFGIAYDADAGTIKFYKNNTLQSSSFSSVTANNYMPQVSLYHSGSFVVANFGQDSSFAGNKTAQGNADGSGQGDFYYAPPSGYKALCSANLPDPGILLPNKHFDTLLYTGNGGSHSVTGLEFQPDWLWIKNRGQADNHQLHDAIRGASKGLISNLSNAEYTDVNAVTAFDSNGFSMNNNYDSHNKSSETYVAWNWNASDTDGKTYTVTVVDDSGNKFRFDGYGTSAVTLDLAEGGTYIFNYPSGHPFRFSTTSDGTHGGGSEYTTGVTHNSSTQVTIVVAASAPTLYYYCSSHSGMGGQVNTNSTLGSSNFDGSIQSTVKANTTAGFSVVTYTGNGSSGSTLGHGLGVAPKAAFVKRRDGGSNWISPFFDLQTAGKLNATDTFTNSYYNTFFTSQPTSSVITIGSNDDINRNTSTYVGYVFSEVAGYSKFGSYTGNGSSDGTFVFTGFRPAVVILKATSFSKGWRITDSVRSPSNAIFNSLFPELSSAEYTATGSSQQGQDFLSNGFKLRNTNDRDNKNGETYIYLAFAESPFKNARAR